jgi:DNA-binding MarR family transcriptional regulator
MGLYARVPVEIHLLKAFHLKFPRFAAGRMARLAYNKHRLLFLGPCYSVGESINRFSSSMGVVGLMKEEGLGFLINDVSRCLRTAFQRRIEGSALTLAQARALVHVSRNPGIRQVELAEILEVQPITLARLIDQLEDAGLVTRAPDPRDRRAYQLQQTKKAVPHLLEIDRVIKSIKEDALRDLNGDEMALVMSALEKMRNNLKVRGL